MGDKFSRLYSFDLGSSFGSSLITCVVKWGQRHKKRHFYLKFNTSSDVKKKLARQKSAAMICIWLPVHKCAQLTSQINRLFISSWCSSIVIKQWSFCPSFSVYLLRWASGHKIVSILSRERERDSLCCQTSSSCLNPPLSAGGASIHSRSINSQSSCVFFVSYNFKTFDKIFSGDFSALKACSSFIAQIHSFLSFRLLSSVWSSSQDDPSGWIQIPRHRAQLEV